MRPLTLDAIEKKFVIKEEHWIWIGATARGYGYISRYGRMIQAHRFFFQMYKGVIPPKSDIHHICGIRNCVNPEHLTATDQKHRGLERRLRTHCPHGHPFDDENTLWINGNRFCHECKKRVARNYAQSHREDVNLQKKFRI